MPLKLDPKLDPKRVFAERSGDVAGRAQSHDCGEPSVHRWAKYLAMGCHSGATQLPRRSRWSWRGGNGLYRAFLWRVPERASKAAT